MSKGLHVRLQLKVISAKEQQSLAEEQLKVLEVKLKECTKVIIVINSLNIAYMLLISEKKINISIIWLRVPLFG